MRWMLTSKVETGPLAPSPHPSTDEDAVSTLTFLQHLRIAFIYYHGYIIIYDIIFSNSLDLHIGLTQRPHRCRGQGEAAAGQRLLIGRGV